MEGSDQGREASRGYLYTIIGALCGASVPTLTKILLADNGPVVVSGLGVLLSGILLLAYRPRAAPSRQSAPYLLFIGVVGAGAAPLLWAAGINETTVINASLLANGEVLFTTLIAFFVLGERLARAQAGRGLLIVAGILVVSTNLDLTHVQFLQGLLGNVMILLATLGWGFENNVIVAASSRFDAATLSKFRNLIGGGVVVASAALMGLPLRLSAYDAAVLALLVLAISGTTYMFIAALQRLGAIKMILVYSLSTVFGAAFGLVILREQVTPAQLLGGALIIAGVYLFRRSERPAYVP